MSVRYSLLESIHPGEKQLSSIVDHASTYSFTWTTAVARRHSFVRLIAEVQVIGTLLRNSFNLNPAIMSVVEVEMAVGGEDEISKTSVALMPSE